MHYGALTMNICTKAIAGTCYQYFTLYNVSLFCPHVL